MWNPTSWLLMILIVMPMAFAGAGLAQTPQPILHQADVQTPAAEDSLRIPEFGIGLRIDLLRAPTSQNKSVTTKTEAFFPNTRPSFAELFKYDTTWQNPETRCYELKQSLSKNYTFLFNLMPLNKYVPGAFP